MRSTITVSVLAFVFHRRGSTNRIVSICVTILQEEEGNNTPGLASRHFLWDNHILQLKESIGWCIYIARFSQIMPVTAVVALLAFVFLRSDDKYRIVSISVTSPKVEQGQYCLCHSSWHFYGKNRFKLKRSLMVFTLTKSSHKKCLWQLLYLRLSTFVIVTLLKFVVYILSRF